jgi:hypothetical protein
MLRESWRCVQPASVAAIKNSSQRRIGFARESKDIPGKVLAALWESAARLIGFIDFAGDRLEPEWRFGESWMRERWAVK